MMSQQLQVSGSVSQGPDLQVLDVPVPVARPTVVRSGLLALKQNGMAHGSQAQLRPSPLRPSGHRSEGC